MKTFGSARCNPFTTKQVNTQNIENITILTILKRKVDYNY